MKELTKIKISESLLGEQGKLMNERYLTFDFKSSTSPRSKYLGRPISFEKDVLTLSTQMYYEGIPLYEMNTGNNVEIFKGFGKEEKLTEGIILSKYFNKASKEDWKTKIDIDETGTMTGVTLRERYDAHKMIEEFMIHALFRLTKKADALPACAHRIGLAFPPRRLWITPIRLILI